MTVYAIEYTSSAAKVLRKLERQTAALILEKIGQLGCDPRPPGAIKIRGGRGEMRVRVGNYRVIYEVKDTEVLILVLAIGHRREIYR